MVTIHIQMLILVTKLQRVTKVLRHLVVKFDFLHLGYIPPPPPFPQHTVDFFDCTVHSAYATLNWGTGGIRDLMLDANKIKLTNG